MLKALNLYTVANKEFLFLLVIWLLTGIYAGPLIYILLPLSLVLLKMKGRYEELFLGFFFILILSDSRQYALSWAGNVKNIYIVLLAVFLFLDRKKFIPFNSFYQRFVPFFLAALIALIYSEVFTTAAQKTISYALLFLVVPNYVQKIWTENKVNFLYNLIFLGGMILLTGLMLKFIMPHKVYVVGRFTGVLGNPNGLGLFSALFFLLLSTIQYFHPDILNKKEKILIYGLIILSIILSGSRSSLATIFIFLFFKTFYRISPFLGFIIFLIMIISYELVTSNLTFIVLALGLEEYLRLDTLESGSGRLIAWNFAWDQIQKNFFIGKGFAHTEYIYKQHIDALSILGHQGNAHNSYLTFWLETGLIGLALFLWGFFKSFYLASKKYIIAIPLLYAIVFSTYFESWLTASLNPFTIQLLIILTILTLSYYLKDDEFEDITNDKMLVLK
ncbi:MAG: O-antigen ligase family protein [Bacteroidota bacterium]|nr:O-antigen ligase family protein [Bacteroidota bacterium]